MGALIQEYEYYLRKAYSRYYIDLFDVSLSSFIIL